MQDCNPGAHGSIQSNGSDVTLTNVDNDISGAGSIGDSHFTLINQAKGVINGNDASNTLDVATGAHAITNAGIFEGTTAQGLFIGSDINNSNLIEALGTNAKVEIDNASIVNTTKGVILASGAGAHVDMQDVSITGGTFRTTGIGAAINLSGNSNIFDGSGVGLPLNSAAVLNLGDGGSLQLKGTINNTGTMTIGSTGNETDLIISGAVTLAGTGHVTLTDDVHNTIKHSGFSATLINVGNTISGAGTIEDLTIYNLAKGVIDATGTHALTLHDLAINSDGKFTATGTGGLFIDHTSITPNTGTKGVLATTAAGAHIDLDLDGSTIIFGTATVVAGSWIDTLNDNSSDLFATKVTNAGMIKADHGDLHIFGAVTNTGVLVADNSSILYFHDAVTGKGGTATIANGGTLEFEVASSANVTFLDHTGKLQLDTATTAVSRFTGTIANFDHGSDIDLGAINYLAGKANIVSFVENAALTSGVLTLSDTSGHSLALTFLGNYAVTDFDTKADSNLHVDLLHV